MSCDPIPTSTLVATAVTALVDCGHTSEAEHLADDPAGTHLDVLAAVAHDSAGDPSDHKLAHALSCVCAVRVALKGGAVAIGPTDPPE